MRIKKKSLLQWGLIILILFGVRYYQQQNLLTEQAPILNLKSISGDNIKSSSANEAVMINFWAVWCGVCHFEHSNIENVAKDYKVLNIAIQSGDNNNLLNYAQENNLNIANIINDSSGAISKIFGVKATPTSFFIKNNKIKFIDVGYTTEIGMRIRMWLLNAFY